MDKELNSNKFSGSIPSSLGYFVKVMWLDLPNNLFTRTLCLKLKPHWIRQTPYCKTLVRKIDC